MHTQNRLLTCTVSGDDSNCIPGQLYHFSCFLFWFEERLFGKAWKEEFVVLYEDSSLIWFRDRDRLDPEGGVFLRDAPEMLAAGQVHILYF